MIKCRNQSEFKEVVEFFPVGVNEVVKIELDVSCQCPCEQTADTKSVSKSYATCSDFLIPLSCVRQLLEVNAIVLGNIDVVTVNVIKDIGVHRVSVLLAHYQTPMPKVANLVA